MTEIKILEWAIVGVALLAGAGQLTLWYQIRLLRLRDK